MKLILMVTEQSRQWPIFNKYIKGSEKREVVFISCTHKFASSSIVHLSSKAKLSIVPIKISYAFTLTFIMP